MATKKERPAPQKAPRTAKPAEQSKPAAAQSKSAAAQSKPAAPQLKPLVQKSSFSGNGRAELSPDEVRKLVSEAAYYRAKQRGFTPGHEVEDWVQAEAEVMRRIEGKHPSQ